MKDLFVPFGSLKTTTDPSLPLRMTTDFVVLAGD
jgi:hypothetical protein